MYKWSKDRLDISKVLEKFVETWVIVITCIGVSKQY